MVRSRITYLILFVLATISLTVVDQAVYTALLSGLVALLVLVTLVLERSSGGYDSDSPVRTYLDTGRGPVFDSMMGLLALSFVLLGVDRTTAVGIPDAVYLFFGGVPAVVVGLSIMYSVISIRGLDPSTR